jgi:phosphatidylglycerophosphatase A
MVKPDRPLKETTQLTSGWQPPVILFVASCGGLGRLPLFPGTWGSLLGLVTAIFFYSQKNYLSQLIIALILFFIGVWVSHKAEIILKQDDPSSVVIDELVGFFVAILFLPIELSYLIGAFTLFRLLDIWKPWSWLESFGQGWGIMLDDIAAGITTNILLQLYIFILG